MNVKQIPLKTIGWHLGSMAAGAYAMIVFASSHSIDLYAIFDQLNLIWGGVVKLGGMVAPFIAAGLAGYRMFGMKQVPKNAIAVLPHDYTVKTPTPDDVAITDVDGKTQIGKVVG